MLPEGFEKNIPKDALTPNADELKDWKTVREEESIPPSFRRGVVVKDPFYNGWKELNVGGVASTIPAGDAFCETQLFGVNLQEGREALVLYPNIALFRATKNSYCLIIYDDGKS